MKTSKLDGWIPVTDALPKEGQRVLVVCTNPQSHYQVHISMSTYYRLPDGRAYWTRKYHVTHWMPLPDMPREVV